MKSVSARALWNSDFGLLSGFGLRSSDFRHAEHDLPSTGRTLEQPWRELDRRTVAAGQNVFGTRETEPQNLAALDKNVRAPITRANNQRVSKGHEDTGLV